MSADKQISIPANTPFEFNGLDMRPAFRAGQNGEHTYSVNIMVDEKIWEALKTIPRHHLIGGVLYWSTGDEHGQAPVSEDDEIEIQIKKPTKKDLKERGEYGKYWNVLCKQGLFNMPDLQTAIQNELGDDVTDFEQGLRDVFEVSSRTFIHPEAFEAWLKKHSLLNIVTISRQAAARATG